MIIDGDNSIESDRPGVCYAAPVMLTRSIVVVTALLLTFGTGVSAAGVQTITHGRAVELTDHLVPGKYVLFDFYADWCGPCRALEPHLLELAGRHADQLVLRKVDVINWESEVARQYGMTSIPYLVLYGPDGNRLAAGDAGSVLRRLSSGLGDDDRDQPVIDRGSGAIPLLAIAAIFAVAVGLVVRRRRQPVETQPPATGPASAAPVDTAADPGDPAIWFTVLQSSVEGPFTRAQLADLSRRDTLPADASVRRRGDADWSNLSDVLD